MPGQRNSIVSTVSDWLVGLASFALIVFIGLIDHVTGYEISFSIFFLIPILVSVWYGDQNIGYVACFASAGAWMMVEKISALPYSQTWINRRAYRSNVISRYAIIPVRVSELLVSCPANNHAISLRLFASGRVATPRNSRTIPRRRASPDAKIRDRNSVVICGTGHWIKVPFRQPPLS
jgi:hypothetical protein